MRRREKGSGNDDHHMCPGTEPMRSLLFVPAVDGHRMEKALSLDADGVIFDLEDAVAVSMKPAGRAEVRRWMTVPRTGRLYVRVNSVRTPFGLRDLEAVTAAEIDGIVLPMADGDAVRIADWTLSQMEGERGLEVGRMEILPLVETAHGLDVINDLLTASARIKRVGFGAGDWCADTRMVWSASNPAFAAARFAIATASRACGREQPVDTAFADVHDENAFAAEAQLACDMGFQGKMCIHPSQVAAANRIFSPSEEEVARAREIWTGFSAAEADGVAALMINERFVDYPVALQARDVLRRAGALSDDEG